MDVADVQKLKAVKAESSRLKKLFAEKLLTIEVLTEVNGVCMCCSDADVLSS